MIRNRDIIFFAPYVWNRKAYGSCRRYVDIFSRENRVLYINNIQFLMPRVSEIGAHMFIKRLIRKLMNIVKPLSHKDKNLYIYTPLHLPHYGSSVRRRVNAFVLQTQIRLIKKVLRFQNPIVWIENPVGIILTKSLKPSLVLYYQIDKYECHHELRNSGEIAFLDKKLTCEADLIFCVSLKLFEEKLALRKEGVYYVPHGVDFEHFYKATKALLLPEDLKGIKHPMVGYFGTLDAKNDTSIIRYCAMRRPDISFVLIGEVSDKQEEIQNLPNVHFIGFKEYDRLPEYGRAFDACMMFWKQNEWIEHCNPVKTMEYLAMGKPVISVPFYEISKRYSGIIAMARSPEDFLKKIEEEIAHDSPQRQQTRIDFVRHETWENRGEYLSRLMEERIGKA